MNQAKYDAYKDKAGLTALREQAEELRTNVDAPADVSMFEVYEQTTDGVEPGKGAIHLMDQLGIDPAVDTIQNMITVSDVNVRYILPEIFREAIRLGLRKAPIYPNIVASTQPLNGLKMTMPYINMSDADARFVGEGETITFGGISYGAKEIKVRKMGRGIKITDETRQYSTLNVVSLFLQDFGVRLGYGLDALAIDVLLNGEQLDGSESAPVIGVGTANTLVYADLLRIWIRLSRMGKNATTMIGGEAIAMLLLNLPEYKNRSVGTPIATLDIKTPIPTTSSIFIHGGLPDSQIIIMDPRSTLLKFDSQPLKVESERIVSNQTEASYATLTTGFAIMFRDSRVVLDDSILFSAAGFPAYMNVDVLAQSTIK